MLVGAWFENVFTTFPWYVDCIILSIGKNPSVQFVIVPVVKITSKNCHVEVAKSIMHDDKNLKIVVFGKATSVNPKILLHFSNQNNHHEDLKCKLVGSSVLTSEWETLFESFSV